MFEGMDDLDPVAALAAATTRRRAADRAEAELLALAAHWADLYAVLPGTDAARITVPGTERLVRLAGEGTPEVAEFAPAELAAALSLSSFAGACLVGDALELRHRLPRLWARVMAGTLPAWRARKIAEHTKTLPAEAAAWVDDQVVGFAHKIGLKRVLDLVTVALLRFDPEQAARRAKAAQDGRGVHVGDETHDGTRSIHIEADALDVAEFDTTITAIADALAALGNTDRTDLRRATAIGVIADPQGTLDLLTQAHGPSQNGDGEGDAAGPAGGAGEAADQSSDAEEGDGADHGEDADQGEDAVCAMGREHGSGKRGGQAWKQRGSSGPGRGLVRRGKPILYIHLHADAVAAHGPHAIARVEGAGPVLAGQVMAWLGRTDLTIQPVLDLADNTPVDGYETPHPTSETVYLTSPCCPFPWCNNLTRNKDTDHIKPYDPPADGGPPGQTRPDNLAKPCRRHHRLKTHGGWTYQMPEPGLYLWRSPLGRRYLVDCTGTTNLTTPDDPLPDETAPAESSPADPLPAETGLAETPPDDPLQAETLPDDHLFPETALAQTA
ncbi:MAG TPA: DUF222 domain-containing protein [Nocardioidaceae bacterium]|nr:DUF222 domain-containing protein [Nocardioidaceae bacterium]